MIIVANMYTFLVNLIDKPMEFCHLVGAEDAQFAVPKMICNAYWMPYGPVPLISFDFSLHSLGIKDGLV